MRGVSRSQFRHWLRTPTNRSRHQQQNQALQHENDSFRGMPSTLGAEWQNAIEIERINTTGDRRTEERENETNDLHF